MMSRPRPPFCGGRGVTRGRHGPRFCHLPHSARNRSVPWSSYKIDVTRDKVGVFVSLVSTRIPFKGTGKEYIGERIPFKGTGFCRLMPRHQRQ